MSEITPVGPVVLSNYTTTRVVDDQVIRTVVKHVERNGVETVEKTEYSTYNSSGKLEEYNIEENGKAVDILL